jgi:hypothetical protein
LPANFVSLLCSLLPLHLLPLALPPYPWRPHLMGFGPVQNVAKCVSLTADLPNIPPCTNDSEIFTLGGLMEMFIASTTLHSMVCPPFIITTDSDPTKVSHVVTMESFFHLERRQQHPHVQNLKTIGPLLPHAPGLNSPKSYTTPHRSRTTPSTDSSAFGVLHWYLITTLHQSSITTTFTRQSTQ